MSENILNRGSAQSLLKAGVELVRSVPGDRTVGAAMAHMAAHRWADAARLLRVAVARKDDPGLWMQYGHALKEAGFLIEAGHAYERVRHLAGDSADLLVQLGHFRKISGEFHKAAELYRAAAERPDLPPALKPELDGYIRTLSRVLQGPLPHENGDARLLFSCAAPKSLWSDPRSQSSGMGKANYSYAFALRGFQRAADALGIPWSFVEAAPFVPDVSALTDAPHPIHLAFYPPSDARLIKGAYNILCFAWEFPILPDGRNWGHAFNSPARMLGLFDEIWTPSSYAAEVVSRYTEKPVHFVPSPILPERTGAPARRKSGAAQDARTLRRLRRAKWVPLSILPRLQGNFDSHAVARQRHIHEVLGEYAEPPKVFLSIFNPHDLRKQIRPMIEGFLKLLETFPNAILLLKTVLADEPPSMINRHVMGAQMESGGLPVEAFVSQNVWLTNATLSEEEMSDLYGISDFYLCTSFAEGQNLPVLEGMSQGVVPVTVRHTAMTDYIEPEHAIVIEHEVGPLPAMLQETYRLWGQDSNVVTADKVHDALRTACGLGSADYDTLARRGMAMVAERFGSDILASAYEQALGRAGEGKRGCA
jgi:glycosyltransferase involved in cell wall biosynthesis